MAIYHIEPSRDTLHGTFSRKYPPILTIDSGDTVLFRTLNSGWVLEPPSFQHGKVKEFEPRIKGRDDGHTLALRPFMGVMGMPPDEPGIHPTSPPRFCGGNMDCKELVAGSTLYLPITVPEALFSVGDGHAVQGDGEVSGVAIECPMERVDLTFHLRDDMHLTTPRANTSSAWITPGFHENLHEASLIALEAMLDLMEEQHQLSRPQALALASLIVDLHVTQIVNGVLGVHAVLPHGAIK